MGYFLVNRDLTPEPPPTSPPADPIEELFYALQEGESADLLDGVSLEAFRSLYAPMSRLAYREASLKLVAVVAFALDWMRTPHTEVRYWQAAFALGVPDCVGQTMATKSAELGLKSRAACLSQGAVKFCQGAGIPPSGYMKGPGTGKAYRDAREAYLSSKEGKA